MITMLISNEEYTIKDLLGITAIHSKLSAQHLTGDLIHYSFNERYAIRRVVMGICCSGMHMQYARVALPG